MSGPPVAGGMLLAVDGGASKTDVWLVDADGTVLGTSRGGGSNHQFCGLEAAMDALGSAIGAAVDDAGLVVGPRLVADTGVYCMAGVDLAVDEERFGDAIGSRGWTRVDHVHNDSLAVLRAGVRSGWGVGLVCGSGINCVGLAPDGSVVRFPSLGELSGDFAAGGSWLGVRTLGLALRSRDGRGAPTELAQLVPAHFHLADPEAVLTAVYTGEIAYGRLFELAQICVDAAAAGDRVAVGAVGILADEVVTMVTATVARMGMNAAEVEVVLGRGLFDSGHPAFAERIATGVRRAVPHVRFRRLTSPPVVGAALLALDAVGASVQAEARLRSSAPSGGPGRDGRLPPSDRIRRDETGPR